MKQTFGYVIVVLLAGMFFGTASVADERKAGAGATSSRADSNKEKSFNADLEVVEPPLADEDEPFAKEISLRKAADYLDAVAVHWTRTKKCATCHTNVPYLLARPVLSKQYPETGEVRAAFEQWSDHWDELTKGKTSTMAVVRMPPMRAGVMVMHTSPATSA
jgi:hypothetical protein